MSLKRAVVIVAGISLGATACQFSRSTTVAIHAASPLATATGDSLRTAPGTFAPAMSYIEERSHQWIESRKCISCHTVLPFMMARSALGNIGQNAVAGEVRAQAISRVTSWDTIVPWYTSSEEKTEQAKGSEVVINAAVLVTYDNGTGRQLQPETRKALDLMLSSQQAEGGWAWLDYQMEPWESADARFFGASLAAITVGSAPENYASSFADPAKLNLLKTFLRSAYEGGELNLHNELMVLWASSKLSGILTSGQKQSTINAAFQRQNSDGSWSMSALGDWQEQGTANPAGHPYATSLSTLALLNAGVSPSDSRIQSALTWLKSSFDRGSGRWSAHSVNYDLEFSHDLMTDAANAYTMLALKRAGAL